MAEPEFTATDVRIDAGGQPLSPAGRGGNGGHGPELAHGRVSVGPTGPGCAVTPGGTVLRASGAPAARRCADSGRRDAGRGG